MSSSESNAPFDRRSLLIALLVPAAVVAFDVLTGKYIPDAWSLQWLPQLIAITIAEVAVVAWLVGRYVRLSWLKWGVFVWTIALVNLGVFSSFPDRNLGEIPLIFAQGTMLLAWMVLSDIAWVWRLPVVIIALTVILPVAVLNLDVWSLDQWHGNSWIPLLAIGLAAQAIVFLSLRLRGIRLTAYTTSNHTTGVEDDRGVTQFGIKHLLIWTSVLAPLLTIVRMIEWRFSWWLNSFGRLENEWAMGLSIGLLFALGGLVTVWAVLGSGRNWLRLTVALVVVGGIGGCLTTWSNYLYETPSWAGFDSITLHLLDLGMYVARKGYWISWVFFAYGLLAALLLFLRASGQRLVRVDATRPSGERAE